MILKIVLKGEEKCNLKGLSMYRVVTLEFFLSTLYQGRTEIACWKHDGSKINKRGKCMSFPEV